MTSPTTPCQVPANLNANMQEHAKTVRVTEVSFHCNWMSQRGRSAGFFTWSLGSGAFKPTLFPTYQFLWERKCMCTVNRQWYPTTVVTLRFIPTRNKALQPYVGQTFFQCCGKLTLA
jgi:hypothetical protein